jgi:hypothetical protein
MSQVGFINHNKSASKFKKFSQGIGHEVSGSTACNSQAPPISTRFRPSRIHCQCNRRGNSPATFYDDGDDFDRLYPGGDGGQCLL